MKNSRFGIAFLFALAVVVAQAGNVSSLEVECYLDSRDVPSSRVVGSGESAEVYIDGSWFASGKCDLYVDGVLRASSIGEGQSWSLGGADGTWRTYNLLLKSGDVELSRVLTFLPADGYACLLHHAETGFTRLDASPAGTTRRLKGDATMDVSWSGMWSDSATGADILLYSGKTASGDPVATLVTHTGRDEGSYGLSKAGLSLASGDYTLTHFDGVETLTAYLRIVDAGFFLLFR